MSDTTLDRVAGEVVIRHVCHCDTATERPADDNPTVEHVFTVDGEDFPWPISTRGPIVTQVTDDLYTVNVEIFVVAKDDGFKVLPFGYTDHCGDLSYPPFIPVINGREFPWLCDDSGYKLEFGHKMLPTLTVSFLAHHVDANIKIGDARHTWEERAVYCAGGDIIRTGKDPCFWCGGLYGSDMFEHHKQAHPEHLSIGPDGQEGYRAS